MNKNTNKDFENTIIAEIYDAALNINLWPNIIQKIVDYTNSRTAIFTALDQLNPNSDFVHTYNIPSECLQAYSDERIKVIDMKLHVPLWSNSGIGSVMYLDLEFYKDAPLESDERIFYERCLKPTGISKSTGVLLDQAEYRWAVFALHRAPTDPEYNQETFDFLTRLNPHIRRSLQIHKQFSLLKSENKNLYRVLNLMKVGVMIINQNQELHYSNLRAQKILESSKLFEFDQNNRISVQRHQQSQFEKILRQSISKQINSFQLNGFMSLKSETGEDFLVTVSPFPNHALLNEQALEGQDSFAAIFITKSNERYQLAIPYLQEVFGLTKRESEICELFVNGFDFQDIANFCNLSISSVRTYFKSIYTKLNCNSQTEVLRKLISFSINFEHISQ